MEEEQASFLFSLSIDPVTKNHLSETARWAKFLAIVGIIALTMMILGGAAYSFWLSSIMQDFPDRSAGPPSSNYSSTFGIIAVFFLAIMAVIAFFPLLFMLRFAKQMRVALNANDQDSLNASFLNLKRYFRYLGILAIIYIAIWLLWILVFGLTAMAIR